ncbi:uncharacterized protein HD556DRAFT_1223174 [Suillus plorans]|uniref:RNase H type-1 domain-containing protein n=1 Tax=Suillus plorans TaxID=116603 RepID=A0A9P7E4A3_9AGAM|nr:uncharacterized protein HD556DRAFT_1223174 [Suillus plorans]KAG1810285.1 hypothetical protein HD556DRAFT_1223174 [Suillus plorans]
MLKMAKKHNMCFALIKLSQTHKQQLPAWLHCGALLRTYHKLKDACLKQIHEVKSIKDLLKVSNRPTTVPHHWESHDCICGLCVSDRLAGCKNPHKCISTVAVIINNLTPKFNPFYCPINDGLTLTHCRLEKNTRARTQHRGDIIFDPSVSETLQLAECFRIFAGDTRTAQAPAHRLQRPNQGQGQQEPPIEIYTDSSCINNGKNNAQCGSGIWFGENNPLNKAIRITGKTQSNQAGEVAAILIGL